MYHEGTFRSHGLQYLSQCLSEVSAVNPEELPSDPGGIGQRAQEVEDGAQADLLTDSGGIFHRRVESRRKQESDAHLVNAVGDLHRGEVYSYSQRLHQVGTATAAGHRAIAVFSNPQPRPGNHEGHRSGNVEGSAAIPTGAAGIHQVRSL